MKRGHRTTPRGAGTDLRGQAEARAIDVRGPATAVLLGTLTVVLVSMLVQLRSPTLQFIVVVGVVAAVAAVVVVATHGTAALAGSLLLAAVFLLPMNGIRRSGLTASDVLLVLAAGVGLLHSGLPQRSLALPRRFGVGLGVLVIAGAIGSFTAQGEGIGNFARLLATVLLAVVGLTLWHPSLERVRLLAYAWLAGSTVNVAVAVAGMPALAGRRPSGLTTHPNALGLVSALSVAFAIFVYTTGDRRARSAALAAGAVSVIGVIVSGSRAAALATVVALVIRTFLAGRWRTAAVGVTGAAVTWALVDRFASRLPDNSALNRLLHPSSSVELSNSQRLGHFRDSIDAFRAHPWTGSGFAEAASAHDVLLQIAVASGLVGLAGFTLACWPTMVAVWTKDAGAWRWVALPAVTFFVAALISNNLWDRYVWFCLGLGMLAYVETRRPTPAEGSSPPATLPEPAAPSLPRQHAW